MGDFRPWLSAASNTYDAPRRVFKDIESLLTSYPTLHVRSSVYNQDNGQVSQLICIEGTVTIFYKNSQYHIPIIIWIPKIYPRSPPVCFVVPTHDMIIKPSKHVDSAGKIYMPYLHTWMSNPENSNLTTLVRLMSEIFSETPPLYSRPPPQAQAAPQASNPYASPPTNPYGSQPIARPVSNQPPSYPPNTSVATNPNGYQRPANSSPTSALPPNVIQYGQPRPASNPPFPVQNQYPQNSQQDQRDAEELERVKKASLLGHVSQEVTQKLEEHKINCSIKLADYNEKISDLEKKQRQVLEAIQENENNSSLLDHKMEELSAANQRLVESIEALSSTPTFSPDESFTSVSVVHNQLLDLVCHDLAIDDMLYYLAKALDKGKMDCATYLKIVRSLARDQFLKKALINKIKEELHLSH